MAVFISVGGANKTVKGVWVSVGGAWKKVANAWSSEGNVYKQWWKGVQILAGTSLSAFADNGTGNSSASVSITYNTNGTVTRDANASGSSSSENPGSPVPNWNSLGGTYVSWTRVSWNVSNDAFPEGTQSQGVRQLMTVPFTVGVGASYNSADPPGSSGNGTIRMSIWASASSPVPIATQSFGMSVSAS